MDEHRTASPWAAAVRLGLVVSAVGAAIAVALTAFGDVSQTALVIAVIIVGFIVSWIHTGRSTESAETPREPAMRESRHVRAR